MPSLPLLPTLMPPNAPLNDESQLLSYQIDFAKEYGPGDGVTDYTAAFAEAMTRNLRIVLGDGTWCADTLRWLPGQRSTIQGIGSKSILKQNDTATGDFVILDDFDSVPFQRGWDSALSHLKIIGGAAGNRGVVSDLLQANSIVNISVEGTVNEAIFMVTPYFTTFRDITVSKPVNGVPWIVLREPNACRIEGIGLRSADTQTLGTTRGAFVIDSRGTFAPHDIHMHGCWDEFLQVDEGGCIWEFDSVQRSNIQLPLSFDSNPAIVNSTDTAHVRFSDSVHGITFPAGNNISGGVLGRNTNSKRFAYGMDLLQSGNRIDVTKGYQSHNIRVAASVGHTRAILGGRESSAFLVGFEDNSGEVSNKLIDDTVLSRGTTAQRPALLNATSDAGREFFDTDLGHSLEWDGSQWIGPRVHIDTSNTGDGVTQVFGPVNHGLGTTTPTVTVFVNGEVVTDGWAAPITDGSNLDVRFGTAPNNGDAITVKVEV